jgi:hypothetical protein
VSFSWKNRGQLALPAPLITRKDFRGLVLGAGGGISTYGDHASKQLSALFGASSGNSGLVAGVQWITEDPVRQSTREWAGGGDGADNIYAVSSAIPFGRLQDAVNGKLCCGTASNTIAPATGTSCGNFDAANDPNLLQGREVLNANLHGQISVRRFDPGDQSVQSD